uniref:Uncharacterized protein n=1 Tax=Arundo donax TaxID=35708 RepID=A0A0A8ZVF6_ARUDO
MVLLSHLDWKLRKSTSALVILKPMKKILSSKQNRMLKSVMVLEAMSLYCLLLSSITDNTEVSSKKVLC